MSSAWISKTGLAAVVFGRAVAVSGCGGLSTTPAASGADTAQTTTADEEHTTTGTTTTAAWRCRSASA